MKVQNEYWGGYSGISPLIPANTYYEFIGNSYFGGSGISVPVVRAWEESDPVYYMVDDCPIADLKARDVALATFVTDTAGGVFNKDFWSFNNDTTNPYEYGMVGKVATTNFPVTATAKAWQQFTIPATVRSTADLTMKLIFAMSTGQTGKTVTVNFDYDLIAAGDSITSPTVSQSKSEEFSVTRTVANEVETHTSAQFTITAADLALLTIGGKQLAHSTCAFSIERTNSSLNNHGGTLQLLGVIFYQSL